MSEEDISNSSRDVKLKEKRRGRSKIFRRGNEEEEEFSPKFIYNRMESIP